MTSLQNSSQPRRSSAANAGRSLLGEAYHPHAIEVQDFKFYGAVFDVRPRAAYDEDHIPGARHLDIRASGSSASGKSRQSLPDDLEVMESIDADRTFLIYCGDGGRRSEPVAVALRRLGRRADVLPGGYINYRRWVQAGLDVLPRLVSWRMIDAAPGHERRALHALRRSGHQVLDLEALAENVEEQTGAALISQPGFESRLVDAMRRIDARSPVVVAPSRLGRLVLPAGLARAVAAAPETASRDAAQVG